MACPSKPATTQCPSTPAGSQCPSTPAGSQTTIPVTDVTLSETSCTLTVGTKHTLYATIIPSNATNKGVTWGSSYPEIASINGGVITALKEGLTIVYVNTNAGAQTKGCTVKVKSSLPVVSMTFDAIWNNPLSSSNITATELASVLNARSRFNGEDAYGSDTWLGNLAPTFIAAGNQYGINPVFLASFAITECGWYRNVNTMVRDQKNIYSWSGDSKGYNSRWMTFNSYEECIDFWANIMVKDYFTPNQGKAKSYGHFDANGNLILSVWVKTYDYLKNIEDRRTSSEVFFKVLKEQIGIR